MTRWTLAIVGLLFGCVYGPEDFRKSVTATDELLIDTPPPPASSPSGEVLYQVLYQDEFGSAIYPAGQRARMLGWLVSMNLSPDQLRGLAELCESVEAIRRADVVDRAKTGARESKFYGSIYAELIKTLAEGTAPDEQTSADLAQRLEIAHVQVHQGGFPLGRQRQRALGVFKAIIQWSGTLNLKQIETLSACRFFLRRRLGPLVNPGHYEWVVGGRWDEGDFDILRYTGSDGASGGMDLGGLWQTEAYRQQRGPSAHQVNARKVMSQQARAILAVAVTEPGLVEAIQVLRGERAALDFGELSAVEP